MIKRNMYYSLQKHLDGDDIVLIVGARQVGKTTLLKQLKASLSSVSYYVTFEDPLVRNICNEHPEKIFDVTLSRKDQPQTICIDEIQYLDDPSNFLKYLYDMYKGVVKLIVTGSSSFYIDEKFRDSLVGRKKVFHLKTLHFTEFLLLKKEYEIVDYIQREKRVPESYRHQLMSLLREYTTYGGYPKIVMTQDEQEKQFLLRQYSYDLIKKDFYDLSIRYDDTFFLLFQLLAGQIGELVNMKELANTLDITLPTVKKYIHILQKSYHVHLITPFHKNIRKELTKMPKVYFWDIGVRNALLNNFIPIEHRTDKGAILENLFFRELSWRTDFFQDIQFWRTQTKKEIDFVFKKQIAYECKWSLKKFKRSAYTSFIETYTHIPLEAISRENILDTIIQTDNKSL